MAELVGSALMFGVSGSSLNDPECRAEVETLKAVHARGVILFDHDIAGNTHRNVLNPAQLTRFIADLKHELGEGTIVAIDQEGGQVDRLRQARGFAPSVSAAAFAVLNEHDQRQLAIEQARQMARLGIDLNFAPCVDLSIEPDSPVIAARERSFGDDPATVVRCARIVIDAHLAAGVGCCLKHFPGHGSALLDSHNDLCDITRTHDEAETGVYRELIGLHGERVAVMAGHLMHRDIDGRLPASLSPAHIDGVLRGELGFGGVVVTDSLDMRAIRDHFGEGRSAALALAAGCDLVLDGLNAPGYREAGAPVRIVDAIARAIGRGVIPDAEERLSASRERVDRFMKKPS